MDTKNKIVSFIKNFSVEYYLEEFKKVEQKQLSWNWSAFLFGPAWFAYRKMPGYCFVSALILIAITLGIYDPLILSVDCKDFIFSPRLYIFLAVMFTYVIMHGILGNSLYFRQLRKNKQIEISQPVAPIFGSLSLFYYISCFRGSLWLRHYHMTHNYRSSILIEVEALLGIFASWIFVIVIMSIFYKVYSLIVNHKEDFMHFNSKSFKNIIFTMKSSLGLWIVCILLIILTEFVFSLIMAITFYAAYKFIITHDVKLTELTSKNVTKILSIKSSIVWWSIPSILTLGLCYYPITEYIEYFNIFMQKI